MTALNFVAGDVEGGPHVHVVWDGLTCEPEDITDEQVVEGRAAVRKQYRAAFGEDPQSVVVWVV